MAHVDEHDADIDQLGDNSKTHMQKRYRGTERFVFFMCVHLRGAEKALGLRLG